MPGTLHLLHGFMGVGKTTLARRLERELPGIRFSQDEWMVALYGEDPPESEYRAAQDRVRGVMEGCWRRCLELGGHVILDSGVWRRSERDHLRAVAAEVGADTVLIRFPNIRKGAGCPSISLKPYFFHALRAKLCPDMSGTQFETA